MNLLLAEAATTGATGGGMNTWVIIVYVVLIGAMMYFMIIKPQKKQRKEQAELMSRMEVGDSVMTTAGFLRRDHRYDGRHRHRRIRKQQELPHPDAEAGDRPDRETCRKQRLNL